MKKSLLVFATFLLALSNGCVKRSFNSSVRGQAGQGSAIAGHLVAESAGDMVLTMNLEILTIALPTQAEIEEFISLLIDESRADGKGLKFRGVILTHRDFTQSDERQAIEANFKLLSGPKYKNKVVFVKIDSESPLNWSRDWVPLYFQNSGNWFSVEPAYFKNSEEFAKIKDQLAAKFNIPNERRIRSEKRLEGGNIASNGTGTCLVGEGGAGPRSGAASEGVDQFLVPSGCQKVVWLPAINDPEIQIAGTNHIDMWMKLVSPTKAAVAEIDQKLLADYKSVSNPNANKYVKAFAASRQMNNLTSAKTELDTLINHAQKTLQDGADRLAKAGFSVFRVPVFSLNVLNASLNGIQNGNRVILSTSVPSDMNLGSQNRALWRDVEARAKQAFADNGITVDAVVDASRFPQESGAYHCGSAHIPWGVVKHLFEKNQ